MGMKLFPLTMEQVEEFRAERSLRVKTLIPASLVNQATSSFEKAPSWLTLEGLRLCCWPPVYWAACQLMEEEKLRFSILGFGNEHTKFESTQYDDSFLIHAVLRSAPPNQNTPGTILFTAPGIQIQNLLFSVSSVVPNSVDLSIHLAVTPATSDLIPDHGGDWTELALDDLTPINRKLLGLHPW
jgi:hypothetical protein